jgi:hypothetical protein
VVDLQEVVVQILELQHGILVVLDLLLLLERR